MLPYKKRKRGKIFSSFFYAENLLFYIIPIYYNHKKGFWEYYKGDIIYMKEKVIALEKTVALNVGNLVNFIKLLFVTMLNTVSSVFVFLGKAAYAIGIGYPIILILTVFVSVPYTGNKSTYISKLAAEFVASLLGIVIMSIATQCIMGAIRWSSDKISNFAFSLTRKFFRSYRTKVYSMKTDYGYVKKHLGKATVPLCFLYYIFEGIIKILSYIFRYIMWIVAGAGVAGIIYLLLNPEMLYKILYAVGVLTKGASMAKQWPISVAIAIMLIFIIYSAYQAIKQNSTSIATMLGFKETHKNDEILNKTRRLLEEYKGVQEYCFFSSVRNKWNEMSAEYYRLKDLMNTPQLYTNAAVVELNKFEDNMAALMALVENIKKTQKTAEENAKKANEERAKQNSQRTGGAGNNIPTEMSQLVFFGDCKTMEELDARRKDQIKKNHPDNGGSDFICANINREYEIAKKLLANA